MSLEEGSTQELLPLGTLLSHKYRIDQIVATGGMGTVYEGTHLTLQKRVAIKILKPELLTSSSMAERFKREAIAASQIGHENIVEVTDIGESAEGRFYIVMEYLDGKSLAHHLESVGQLAVNTSLEIASEILSAMTAAHEIGIVHRDLKPDNIFLAKRSRDETIKILDFGISRMDAYDEESNQLTSTGIVLGTPFYMSPEQARGDENLSVQTDIYSIGVILYEMLAGTVPFKASNYNEFIFKVITGDFPELHTLRNDVPPEVEHMIKKAMSINLGERYASAAEFEEAILNFHQSKSRSWSQSLSHLPGKQEWSIDETETTPRFRIDSIFKIAVPILFAAILLVIYKASGQSSTDKPNSISSTPSMDHKPVVLAENAVNKNITLSLNVDPKESIVTIDDVVENRRTIDLVASNRTFNIKASSPGYVTQNHTISLDSSHQLALYLEPLPTRSTSIPNLRQPTRRKKINGRKKETAQNKKDTNESATERGVIMQDPYK